MTPGRTTLMVALLLAGLSAPVHGATIEITIENLVYAPAVAHAKVGDTVVWDNKDILAHTATATNGDWNVMIAPKKSARLELHKAGTFDYFCKFHPNMKARLVVAP